MSDYVQHQTQYTKLTSKKFREGLSLREEKTRQYLKVRLDLIEMKEAEPWLQKRREEVRAAQEVANNILSLLPLDFDL